MPTLVFKIITICLFGHLIFSTASSNFQRWTCDEITPNLCSSIQVNKGFISVRGINVHYWRYFTNSSSTTRWPVITIHGGPSFPHDYLLPLRQLACHGHDVIFYDQAGCGESSLPPTAHLSNFPWLFDPSYYAEVELPALISTLRVSRYHLFGHSWGTIVAQQFAISSNVNRAGLRSLMLAGPLSDAQLYVHSQWDPLVGSVGTIPDFVQGRLRELEKNKKYDSEEYIAITQKLTAFFTCRTAPMPDCAAKSFRTTNDEIYVGVQGASEFTIGGVLKNFNSTSELPRINVPTLLSTGEFDTMRPPVVDVMLQQINPTR